MGVGFAAAIAGRRDAHQPGVEAILHIALEDAVLDQDIFLGRRAFVVDRQRAAAIEDAAIVDHGDARRGDALADAAGKGAGALAVEIAFQAMADRFMDQHARPAGAEQHGHLAGGGGDRAEIDLGLGQRLVNGAVPDLGVHHLIIEIAAADTEHAGFAPAIFLQDDRDVEADERADVAGGETVGADDLDHRPTAG